MIPEVNDPIIVYIIIMYLTNKKRGTNMGFSMGVYCDLMGINRIFDGICWDIYIYIYIYILWLVVKQPL